MSLKAVVTSTMVVFGALALVAAGSLVLLTSYLHRTTESLTQAVDGVRIAEQLEVDLLNLIRQPNLAGRIPLDTNRLLTDREESIRRHLAEARRQELSEQERELLAEAEQAISYYLLQREGVRNVTDPAARAQVLAPPLEAALDSLERLVELNVKEAHL
ncbi:MAG TPA: hypothetical protein VEY88_15285, partial [Archangium sp.]|nr:hypothetical protein [Archangium sp.]